MTIYATRAEIKQVIQGTHIHPRVERGMNDLIDSLALRGGAVEDVVETFDDFQQVAIDTTDKWIAVAGATATIGAIVASPEGKIDMVSGTNGTAGVTDAAAVSSRVITHGQAVSLGEITFEARISVSHVTGATVCVGLSDKIASGSAEAVLHTVKSEVIADDGLTVSNALSFAQDSEATNVTNWYATSENAGTIAHAAAAADCLLAAAPTVDTYQVLKIVVNAKGDAFYYVDGLLKFTELTAVATTAILVPYIAVTAEDGTPVATTLSIDYIKFVQFRPSAN